MQQEQGDAARASGETPGWLLSQTADVGIALRSGRRRLGYNQRELARLAGISQATVARLEAGADAHFTVVTAALAACGLLVVAVPPGDAPDDWAVHPHPSDEGRDTGGRRLPAHLPAYSTDYLPMYTMWKRMVRGESVMAERPPHWIYAREAWPFPPPLPRDRGSATSD